MVRFAIVRAFAMLALLACVTLASAQQAPLVGIEPIRATLDQMEAQARRNVGARDLGEMSQQLSPIRDDLRNKLADLEPRLADLDARLKGLGDAPAAGAPAENPTIAAERARLAQQRGELDAAVKQVQLLQARAQQLAASLSDRRLSAYAETMFRRTPNLLDPYFWRDVFAALPDEGARVVALAANWTEYARERSGIARIASAALALAGLLAFAIGLMRWWRRTDVIGRVGARFGSAVAAFVMFLRRALVAPAIVIVVLELLDQFELVPPDHARLVASVTFATVVAALARAAAISVLAPDDPSRRLLKMDDARADWLSWHLIWGGRLFGALIVLRSLHRTIAGPEPIDVALRMWFAVAIAALLVHLLVGRKEDDEATGRRIPGVRLLSWIVVAVIGGALLAGYARFAAFVAGRVVFTVALVATLYLLLIVTDALVNRTMSAESARGRKLARQLGIEPRRLGLFGKLTSGIVRALFVLIVIALAIGRWEITASDIIEAIRGITFGIRIGDFTISFGDILGAALLFLVLIGLTRLIQRWLDSEVMPQTAIEPGLRHSIVTIIGYVGFIIAVVIALGQIGIDPQKIALIAGALSVGIGFGLQSIVSNFVSGLILLAERPIRVGDQIIVKSEEGFVRRISVRATEIETFDKASVIIPNSELITGVVKNWTHANMLGRVHIKVAVSYDCDPDKVMEILKNCVNEHPDVVKPGPAVLLSEFAPSAVTFEIFCIVSDLGQRGRIKSDIQIAILRAFRAAGIDMTPAQDVRLVGGSAPPGRPEAAGPAEPGGMAPASG